MESVDIDDGDLCRRFDHRHGPSCQRATSRGLRLLKTSFTIYVFPGEVKLGRKEWNGSMREDSDLRTVCLFECPGALRDGALTGVSVSARGGESDRPTPCISRKECLKLRWTRGIVPRGEGQRDSSCSADPRLPSWSPSRSLPGPRRTSFGNWCLGPPTCGVVLTRPDTSCGETLTFPTQASQSCEISGRASQVQVLLQRKRFIYWPARTGRTTFSVPLRLTALDALTPFWSAFSYRALCPGMAA